MTAESSIFKNTLKAKPLRNTAKINQDPDAWKAYSLEICVGKEMQPTNPEQKILRQTGLVHNVERGGQKVEIKKLDLEEQTITRVEVPVDLKQTILGIFLLRRTTGNASF